MASKSILKKDYIDTFIEEWQDQRPGFRDLSENAGIYRVLRIAAHLEQEMDSLARDNGLRAGQFQLLAALRRRDPEPLPVSSLARAAILTSGSITSALDRLEESGLVTRQDHPGDRRSVLVSLTPQGRKRADKILALRNARLAELMDELSRAEKEGLSSALRKIALKLGDGV